MSQFGKIVPKLKEKNLKAMNKANLSPALHNIKLQKKKNILHLSGVASVREFLSETLIRAWHMSDDEWTLNGLHNQRNLEWPF